jgi:hypothetical protein
VVGVEGQSPLPEAANRLHGRQRCRRGVSGPGGCEWMRGSVFVQAGDRLMC